MTLERIAQLARLAGGFRKFLRTPIGIEAAAVEIKRRLEDRETNFVTLAKQLIYDVPSSPYRRLLVWAGCEYCDLRARVASHGLESTLEKLRDEGVYLSLDEFKGRAPVVRNGLRFETEETDFDNPRLSDGRLIGETSGSRGKRSRVSYDWDFIAEEARHETLLYAIHGVLDAPFALWYPVPPGNAGLNNLLKSLKAGLTPQKWYSQSPCGIFDISLEARLALEFVIWGSRSAGLTVARPTFASLSDHEDVARWMESTIKRSGRAVLRAFGSSALRMTQTARAIGADLRGGFVFVGGEPLTEPRRRAFEAAGLEVYPRYVSAESGIISAACPNRSVADDMHFFSDHLAMVQLDRGAASQSEHPKTFLFTALSLKTGKILFNTELGDFGEVTTKSCSCRFGEIGLNVHLSNVRSYEKLTIEGMTILTAELDAIIGAAMERAGGRPDSYQFREVQDPSGLHRLEIAVSPEVLHLDEAKFIEEIVAELRRGGPRKAMAADFWGKGDSFSIVREQPKSSTGHKLPAMSRSQ